MLVIHSSPAGIMKTYIVEDSPIVLSNLIGALKELPSVEIVGTAADEGVATEWLAESGEDCALVIVDVFLQRGSGIGVLRAAKHSGFTGKRVVMTNFATREVREACAALGADRVFDKSNELAELIAYCSQLAKASLSNSRVGLH